MRQNRAPPVGDGRVRVVAHIDPDNLVEIHAGDCQHYVPAFFCRRIWILRWRTPASFRHECESGIYRELPRDPARSSRRHVAISVTRDLERIESNEDRARAELLTEGAGGRTLARR